MNAKVLFAVLSLVLLTGAASAYSMQGIDTLLQGYSVPASTVGALHPVSLNYSGSQYVALYKNSTLYFVINVTSPGSYSVVLNATSIFDIIRNYTLSTAISQVNFTALSAQMKKFQASSASTINDCLYETGLSTGTTCSLSNYCQSCQFIPNCKNVLDATDGPSGPVGVGITQFENQYGALNASFNTFYSSVSQASSGGVSSALSKISAAVFNISSISRIIYMNPIFPPTANITPNLLTNCVYYANPASAPWYCTALGYCGNLNYNYSILTSIQGRLSGINALPISDAQILSLAQNTSAIENVYVYPVLSKQKKAQLGQIENTTLRGYGSLVNGSSALLIHVSNAMLRSALLSIESTYQNVTNNFVNLNLTKEDQTLALQMASLTSAYAKVNASYSGIVSVASNNTAKVIALQTTGQSQDITTLAFNEFALNGAVAASNITNLTSLRNSVNAISTALKKYSIYPISLVELARAIDGPFIRAIVPLIGLSYQSSVGLAPALGALLSLIIGIILLVLLVIERARLQSHHKVVLNSKTRGNWRKVFALAIIAVFVYVFATYALLSSANASAPLSAFQGAYGASNTVVLAINGTPTHTEATCAGKLNVQALALNKNVIVASLSNGTCQVGSLKVTIGQCMNGYAAKNEPVVIFTNGTRANLGVYSLYGTTLYLGGNDTEWSPCYATSLTR